jgi:hypothetical protein
MHPGLWTLVARQYGVVTRAQLLDLGFSSQAIVHRLVRGRLHAVWRGLLKPLGRSARAARSNIA